MSAPLTKRQAAAEQRAANRELEQLRAMPNVTVLDDLTAEQRAYRDSQARMHRFVPLPDRADWKPCWRRMFP